MSYRKWGNPVVPLIHRESRTKRLPRPFKTDELAFTWELLSQRGTACLRLAAAIAEEAGLRIGEIGRLRLQDVNIAEQTLFIRLPNKTSRERKAWFSEKTLRYYREWMLERRGDCSHDHLLHNSLGKPCNTQQLHHAFANVLCKKHLGIARHDTGWDSWSTHRWRHTFATSLLAAGADAATVMVSGGWLTSEAMTGYCDVSVPQARRGYEAAMKRAREIQALPPSKKTLRPAEFLANRRKAA